jgi:hypothetical protein
MTGIEAAGAVASIVTAGATTVTLAVLIWYTIETHKLRKAAQRQNESALLPIVVIEEPSQDDPEAFVIRNIGKGPAFQVSASAKTLGKSPQDDLGSGFMVHLQMAPVLAVDESATVRPLVASGKDVFSELAGVRTLAELVVTNKITETFTIEIYYESLSRTAYLTKFTATYVGSGRQFALFYESTAGTPTIKELAES